MNYWPQRLISHPGLFSNRVSAVKPANIGSIGGAFSVAATRCRWRKINHLLYISLSPFLAEAWGFSPMAEQAKICLSFMCWRKVITDRPNAFEDAYPGWPPVKIQMDGALDLEFSPFLLVDKVFMDLTSYMELTRHPPKGLERAVESLRVLHNEGYLALVDHGRELSSLRSKVLAATENKLKRPEFYIESVRTAVDMWDKEGPKYAAAIGKGDDYLARLPVGIIAGLACDHRQPTEENIERMRRIVHKKTWQTSERDLLKEIARPYIDHAHTGIAIYKSFSAPVIDWSDTGPVYESVLSSHIEPTNRLQARIDKTRELFTKGLSTFEPANVYEFLHALKDSRLRDLRVFVAEAAEKKTEFDATFMQKLVSQVARRHKTTGRAGSVLTGLGAATGMILSVFDGGVTTAILSTAGTGAAQEAATRSIDKVLTRDIRWFLCLVDAKGAKK